MRESKKRRRDSPGDASHDWAQNVHICQTQWGQAESRIVSNRRDRVSRRESGEGLSDDDRCAHESILARLTGIAYVPKSNQQLNDRAYYRADRRGESSKISPYLASKYPDRPEHRPQTPRVHRLNADKSSASFTYFYNRTYDLTHQMPQIDLTPSVPLSVRTERGKPAHTHCGYRCIISVVELCTLQVMQRGESNRFPPLRRHGYTLIHFTLKANGKTR